MSTPSPRRGHRCVLIGAGGHAAVLIDAMLAGSRWQPVACLDRDPDRIGSDVLGVPVLGDDTQLDEFREEASHFAVGIGLEPKPGLRRRLFELAREAGYLPATVVHPSAVVSAHARVDAGACVLAHASVGARAAIGANAVINTAAVVEHDCRIAEDAFIAPGALLAGASRVGRGALVGLGSRVLQNLEIGAEAVVGAGATVLRDVAPGERALGLVSRS